MKYYFLITWLFILAGTATAGGADLDRAPILKPQILYTDIISGPTSGGENNKGIYLSLFGRNFSESGLGTKVRVFIGEHEVDNYRYLGQSRVRSDIQQITVQVGELGKAKAGVSLPIKVLVGTLQSNTDLTFTVNPGRILFVDNVRGNDLTAVIGDIKRPFRHVQTSRLREGAWGEVRPGDFIVMRGTGVAWTDRGYQNYFLRFRDKSGTPPMGQVGTGPIGLMGYPGEDVFINNEYAPELERISAIGAISAVNGKSFPGMGQWVTISNLRVEGGNNDGAINVEILGNHWRVVNNELTAASAIGNITAKAGGIVGNGFGQVWLGNYIHDVYCGPAGGGPFQNHGIYIDGDGDYEIAYNLIERIPGGSGFQIYVNGGNGSDVANNVKFHHNLIRDVGKHGINLADGSRAGIKIFNNIIHNTRRAGLRFNSRDIQGAQIFHNTFVNTNIERHPNYGAIVNDGVMPGNAIDLQNNIFSVSPGTPYGSGTVGFGGKVGLVVRNLYFGGKGDISFDLLPITGDPRFVADGRDFHLRSGSVAIDAGSVAVSKYVGDDFDGVSRPHGAGYDVGAYEFRRCFTC